MIEAPSIDTLNLEVTTTCPLRCPQCYCCFNEVRHMDLDVAKHWILEAAKCGCKGISISGGETRCYPHLAEIIAFARDHNVGTSCAFSGWHLDSDYIQTLVDAGIYSIHISLNGSTEQINRLSRDGYDYSIRALKTLKEMGYQHTTINWVMHSFNADDFPNMITLAEEYNVYALSVMEFKPDANNQLPSIPSAMQMYQVAEQIRQYSGKLQLQVENCFSPMRALVLDTAFAGNLNRGKYRGCGAGIFLLSVNVDGTLTPCRHIQASEKWDTLMQYWENSPLLKEIRDCYCREPEEPCRSCKYLPYCRHCMASNHSIAGCFQVGNKQCPLV